MWLKFVDHILVITIKFRTVIIFWYVCLHFSWQKEWNKNLSERWEISDGKLKIKIFNNLIIIIIFFF